MNRSLPQKYKGNIFQKIFLKIKSLFSTKREIVEYSLTVTDYKEKEKTEIEKELVKQVYTENDVKRVENADYEKKKFMGNIANNPELLEKFSNDRLEIILQYFKEENEKKKAILKKLKKNS